MPYVPDLNEDHSLTTPNSHKTGAIAIICYLLRNPRTKLLPIKYFPPITLVHTKLNQSLLIPTVATIQLPLSTHDLLDLFSGLAMNVVQRILGRKR